MFVFESIDNMDDSYKSHQNLVELNFVVFVNTNDLQLVFHLIFDDTSLVEFVCLFHIERRTVRYIYRQKHSDAQEKTRNKEKQMNDDNDRLLMIIVR